MLIAISEGEFVLLCLIINSNTILKGKVQLIINEIFLGNPCRIWPCLPGALWLRQFLPGPGCKIFGNGSKGCC